MKTVISSKGQLVLSALLRERDGIAVGQEFVIKRIEPGQYLIKHQPAPANEGLVDRLLTCPEKNWFQPVASESPTRYEIPRGTGGLK